MRGRRPISAALPIPIPSFYVPGREKYPFSTLTKTIPPTNWRVYGNRRYVSTPNAVKIWRAFEAIRLCQDGNTSSGKKSHLPACQDEWNLGEQVVLEQLTDALCGGYDHSIAQVKFITTIARPSTDGIGALRAPMISPSKGTEATSLSAACQSTGAGSRPTYGANSCGNSRAADALPTGESSLDCIKLK